MRCGQRGTDQEPSRIYWFECLCSGIVFTLLFDLPPERVGGCGVYNLRCSFRFGAFWMVALEFSPPSNQSCCRASYLRLLLLASRYYSRLCRGCEKTFDGLVTRQLAAGNGDCLVN
jgi:hypothetical protein